MLARQECKTVNHLLWEYAEETLQPEVQARVQKHLDGCPDCRRQSEGYRQAVSLMRAGRREAVQQPLASWESMLPHLEANASPPGSETRRMQVLQALCGGLAVAAVCLVFLWLRHGQAGTHRPLWNLPATPEKTQVADGERHSSPSATLPNHLAQITPPVEGSDLDFFQHGGSTRESIQPTHQQLSTTGNAAYPKALLAGLREPTDSPSFLEDKVTEALHYEPETLLGRLRAQRATLGVNFYPPPEPAQWAFGKEHAPHYLGESLTMMRGFQDRFYGFAYANTGFTALNVEAKATTFGFGAMLREPKQEPKTDVMAILGDFDSDLYYDVVTNSLANTTKLDKELVATVRLGNVSRVETLLKEGADVNASLGTGQTPLLVAISEDDPSMVRTLLHCRANVNGTDEAGNTPLIWAVSQQKYDYIPTLLTWKANVNAVDRGGNTALFRVAQAGETRWARTLVDHGAQVNVQNNWGVTPLIASCAQGWTETVDFLVQQKADIEARDFREYSAFVYTAELGRLECAKLLLDRGVEVNTRYQQEKTALMVAAANGQAATMELLLDRGAEINATDKEGWSALMWASATPLHETLPMDTAQANTLSFFFAPRTKENTVTVRLLLNRGADYTLKDPKGRTALKLAKEKEQKRVIELLRKAGAKE